MKKYNLDPTEDNLKKSIEQDATGRNKALYSFIRMLNEQNEFWAVALDARWGSGKTFFVKQVQLLLDDLADKNHNLVNYICDDSRTIDDLKKVSCNTVYYDAWENDAEDDPIISLTFNMAKNPWAKKAIKAAVKALNIAINLATSMNLSLKSINELENTLKDSKTNVEKQKENFNRTLSELIQGKIGPRMKSVQVKMKA